MNSRTRVLTLAMAFISFFAANSLLAQDKGNDNEKKALTFHGKVEAVTDKGLTVNVPVQREMESERFPLASIPPFGRGFSRHWGLPIRCGFWKSAEAELPRSGHRLDEPARVSLGMVASRQSPLPFRLAESL